MQPYKAVHDCIVTDITLHMKLPLVLAHTCGPDLKLLDVLLAAPLGVFLPTGTLQKVRAPMPAQVCLVYSSKVSVCCAGVRVRL